MRRLIALCMVLLIGACATPVVPSVQIPQPRLSPQAMGVVVSVAQRLTLVRTPDGRPVQTRSLDTLLEIDATSLRLAAFALGQRVMTLTWDGSALTSQRHPLLPAEVDAAFVLRDIQWMYAPLESLRAVLPPGWQLEGTAKERVLSHAATPVLLIHYGSDSPWSGRSQLENRLEGYSLTIESDQPAGA